eukprot:TRINITY_DN70904_c0_g1_i1.p2 TRINITY_DN70904_c0_g1~~TRINITY_DN70904_c0_g1_i1.p2  ORF type:complete len:101 (-),score=5.14 TRINITY_DN70904_c0_g1_i1:1036-1338(-)
MIHVPPPQNLVSTNARHEWSDCSKDCGCNIIAPGKDIRWQAFIVRCAQSLANLRIWEVLWRGIHPENVTWQMLAMLRKELRKTEQVQSVSLNIFHLWCPL